MLQESFTTVILKADKSHKLTQVGDIDFKERIISETVALGRYDSAENWREITNEEAEEYLRQQKAAIGAEMNKAPATSTQNN